MYSESTFAILNGTTVNNGTLTTKGWEDVIVTGGTATILGSPSTATAIAVDAKGNQSTVTISGQIATFTTNVPTEGTSVKIIYDMNVTGNLMDLNAANFPKAFKIFYHNVFFNPDTNAYYSDLYIVFSKGIPDGALNLSLSSSKEATDPIKFTLLTLAGSTSFGSYITVPKTNVLVSPTVTPATTNNHVASTITLTFPDNTNWRDNIYDLTVSGSSAISNFTTLPGMIKIAGTEFATAKTYPIIIKSTNYPDVSINQVVIA